MATAIRQRTAPGHTLARGRLARDAAWLRWAHWPAASCGAQEPAGAPPQASRGRAHHAPPSCKRHRHGPQGVGWVQRDPGRGSLDAVQDRVPGRACPGQPPHAHTACAGCRGAPDRRAVVAGLGVQLLRDGGHLEAQVLHGREAGAPPDHLLGVICQDVLHARPGQRCSQLRLGPSTSVPPSAVACRVGRGPPHRGVLGVATVDAARAWGTAAWASSRGAANLHSLEDGLLRLLQPVRLGGHLVVDRDQAILLLRRKPQVGLQGARPRSAQW